MSIMVLTRPSDIIEENKEVLWNCVNRAFKLCFLCVFYILKLQREDTNNIEPYYILKLQNEDTKNNQILNSVPI